MQKPGFAIGIELPDLVEIAERIGVSLAMPLRPSGGEKAGGGVNDTVTEYIHPITAPNQYISIMIFLT
jgi:hypothetical protein